MLMFVCCSEGAAADPGDRARSQAAPAAKPGMYRCIVFSFAAAAAFAVAAAAAGTGHVHCQAQVQVMHVQASATSTGGNTKHNLPYTSISL